MTSSSDVIVSVRVPKADLRKIQLMAEVYDQSVGSLIRAAVKKHIAELANTEEFRARAVEMQQRYDETLGELLKPSGKRPPRKRRERK